MKSYVVIGRTVYKGKELEFKEPLPYYMESQAETLIESAKRRIRIRYHSEYPYSKARLSYSFLKGEGTVKPEKTEKKSIFGAVKKAMKSKVVNMTNKKETRVKLSELSNELQAYVGRSSHYYVDNDDYIHDEWNSPEITEDDIAEQQIYDEKGEL